MPAEVTLPFAGFPDFKSNVTFVPIQFFTVVIPHCSRGTVRIVGYVLRKVLGWVDQDGNPRQEQLRFTYRELVEQAGVSRNLVGKALKEAVARHCLRCVRPVQPHTAGQRARSAVYELCWDPSEDHCVHDPSAFRGFCYPGAVVVEEQEGTRTVRAPKLSRKNIPNAFFDVLLRRDRLSVIRVVGALLFYSIQWGPAGERKVPVSRSITELSRLTGFSRQHVHAAVMEARQRGYIEQVDAGCFDLAAGRESRPATYGIRWAAPGPPAEASAERDRPKKVNGATAQKGERDRPNKVNGERPKMVNDINIKEEHKTPEATASTPAAEKAVGPAAAAAVSGYDLLVKAGFDEQTALRLASRRSREVIQRQIEWLALRAATRSRLGLLRRSIEQDWPKPQGADHELPESALARGRLFASHYYAAYHGYTGAAATEAFPKDVETAAKFVERLIEQERTEAAIPEWGRRFGRFMRARHQNDARARPNLCLALVPFGDAFLRQLEQEGAARRKEALGKAQAAHEAAFMPDYLAYIGLAEKSLQQANPDLYQTFAADRQRLRKLIFSGTFMTTAARHESFESEQGRLFGFAEFFAQHPQHRVLGFWEWDAQLNPRRLGSDQPKTSGTQEARA